MQKIIAFTKSISWRKFFAYFAVFLALIAAIIFWPVHVDLSHITVPEGKYNVRILRDSFGVPHIYGETDADVAFGMAYAHAEDDFETIQGSLLAGKGMLGQVFGVDSAAVDYLVSLLRVADVVDARYESDIAPETKVLLEAYAEGLNHYAALHPDEILLAEAFPVTAKDMVAVSVFQSPMYFGLDGPISELFADERQKEVSPLPGAWYQFTDYQYGSNVFAIAPNRSEDGSTFFAVNSHQPWQGSVTWYEIHLHSEEGWNVVGATFPGVPSVIQGHNENLSWALTVNDPDLTDIYVLEINPINENQYLFDGEWLDLEVRDVPIKAKLVGNLKITVKQETLWSVFGPVVRQDHGVYAIRYSGFGRIDIFQQLYQMNKATNFEEWRTAMYNGALPTFNVGYADNEGNIYYLYNANLPIRAEGYRWDMYLPGTSSDVLWTEYLPAEELPQVLNPPSGFFQNANSSPFSATVGEGNPDPADFSIIFGIEEYDTNRSLMLKELFSADDSISFEEFIAYKFNLSYHPDSDVAEMMEVLARLSFDDPLLQEGQNLLAGWDLSVGIESKEAALGVLTIYFMSENIEDFGGSSLARNEFSSEDVKIAFTLAVEYLEDHFGQIDPAWGDVQRLQRGAVDVPLGGGPDVIRAIYSSKQENGQMKAYSGDGYVMLIAWRPDGSVDSYSIHQFGSATIRDDSPHYDDQSEMFAAMELKPVWFDLAEIMANLEIEYTPWTSTYGK
jgi:penicillin amidase/acyl-homoserine-lactone acylase